MVGLRGANAYGATSTLRGEITTHHSYYMPARHRYYEHCGHRSDLKQVDLGEKEMRRFDRDIGEVRQATQMNTCVELTTALSLLYS